MIWHAHVPLPEDRDDALRHLARVMARVQRGGSLAKILGAKTCMAGLKQIHAGLLPLMRHVPEDQVATIEGIRKFLLEHLMGEFALGIDQGTSGLRQLGTLQRHIAMWPKLRRRRNAG
jgi:hypothetical protein